MRRTDEAIVNSNCRKIRDWVNGVEHKLYRQYDQPDPKQVIDFTSFIPLGGQMKMDVQEEAHL